jgi:cytochrome c oxidase subunit IV
MSGNSEHSSSLTTYFAIWIALLAGTALTVAAAFVDLKHFNTPLALIIATIKATLVALYFMHIKGTSEKMTKVVVVSAIFFLILLLALSMADYGTRAWS